MTSPTRNEAPDIHPAAKPLAFLGTDKTKRLFIWVPLIGFLLTSLLGIFFPQKYPAPWEKIGEFAIPASWALFGLIVFAAVALMTPFFGRLFVKPEGFYPRESLPGANPDLTQGEIMQGELAQGETND